MAHPQDCLQRDIGAVPSQAPSAFDNHVANLTPFPNGIPTSALSRQRPNSLWAKMDTWPLEPEESDETDPADLSTPAFFKRTEFDSLRVQEEQRAAQEEWDKVTNVVGIGTVTFCSRIITYEEALCYFKERDLSSYMSAIRPVIQRRGIKLILHCLFGPPRLKLGLVPARDFTFALAQCPFDNESTLHLEILQTIYRKLTNTVYDCPRYGSHWERIGFQGNDPATDLRGVGLLGILHLLFLTTGFGNIELVNDIYSLSRDREQNFPFALMSLNITKVSIEALREEVLNRCCNERNDVTDVVNEFYAGTFLLLYLSWKNKKLTIKDSGFILKETSFLAKKKPGYVLQNLMEYQEEQSSLTTSQVFTNLAAVEAQ